MPTLFHRTRATSIHLTSDDKTYRLNLDDLKTEVRGWFAKASLDAIMGEVVDEDETEQIARDWLAKGGKRWRPYLATCTYMALASDHQEGEPELHDGHEEGGRRHRVLPQGVLDSRRHRGW